jgi:alkaline phosphatase
MDRLVRQTAAQAGEQTLILFAADHSFDLRVRGGKRGESMLPEAGASPTTAAKPKIRVEDGHTGEQVLAAAQGPGAERVRGFIANTDLFKIMMVAYGWSSDRVDSAGTGKSD